MESVVQSYPANTPVTTIYEEVKARTVSNFIPISGNDLETIFIEYGISDIAYNIAENLVVPSAQAEKLRGICRGIVNRFRSNSSFDFSDSRYRTMIRYFLTHPDVSAALSAASKTSQAAEAAIAAEATEVVPEFPDVSLKQIVQIRNPAYFTRKESSTLISTYKYQRHTLVLQLQDNPVIEGKFFLEMRHTVDERQTEWMNKGVMFSGIKGAGTYSKTLAGELFAHTTELRLVSENNLTFNIFLIK